MFNVAASLALVFACNRLPRCLVLCSSMLRRVEARAIAGSGSEAVWWVRIVCFQKQAYVLLAHAGYLLGHACCQAMDMHAHTSYWHDLRRPFRVRCNMLLFCVIVVPSYAISVPHTLY